MDKKTRENLEWLYAKCAEIDAEEAQKKATRRERTTPKRTRNARKSTRKAA